MVNLNLDNVFKYTACFFLWHPLKVGKYTILWYWSGFGAHLGQDLVRFCIEKGSYFGQSWSYVVEVNSLGVQCAGDGRVGLFLGILGLGGEGMFSEHVVWLVQCQLRGSG